MQRCENVANRFALTRCDRRHTCRDLDGMRCARLVVAGILARSLESLAMATVEPLRASSRPSPTPPVRIGEDAFVSEATVDGWTRSGLASRVGSLISFGDGRRYTFRDAVRVLGRRNGDTDPYGFTGRVETMREFVRRGATLSADALRLGQAVYDVEYGYLVVPSAD